MEPNPRQSVVFAQYFPSSFGASLISHLQFLHPPYAPILVYDAYGSMPLSPSTDLGTHILIPQLVPLTNASFIRAGEPSHPYMLVPQATIISQTSFHMIPFWPDYKSRPDATPKKHIIHVYTTPPSAGVAEDDQISQRQRLVQRQVSEYQRAWQVCHNAALETQDHESLHGDNPTPPVHLQERHALYMQHTLAAQEVLALTNDLLANPDFTGEIYIALPNQDLERHLTAFRITQQFFQTHVDTTSAVLDTLTGDLTRLKAEIDSRKVVDGS